VRGDVPRLTHSAEAVIFQVVQEAFSNVRKHADASQVTVVVTPEKSGQLAVSVRDNGAGFETDQVDRVREEKGSLGMLNMRERARTVNGTLSIASKPGHGTTVTLRVPIATNLARNTNPESDATQPLVPG
jgi:signal transduction histidine kinase